FKRGSVLYSAHLKREVKRGELLAGPSTELMGKLARASDALRSEGRVVRSRLPSLFRTWTPVALADLVESLPDEEAAPDVADAAREDFRRCAAAVFNKQVTITWKEYEERKGQLKTFRQQMTLLQACEWQAKLILDRSSQLKRLRAKEDAFNRKV